MEATTFANMLDAVDEGVFVFGKDKELIFCNKAFAALTGYEEAEVSSAIPEIIDSPLTDRAIAIAIQEALYAEGPFSGHVLVRGKSGEPARFFLKFEPERDAAGNLRHFIGTLKVVADQTATGDAASKMERDYRFIFERLQSAITVHGPDGMIRIANPKAAELLGIEQSVLSGLSPDDRHFDLCRDDGSRLPLEEYPVMRAISERRSVRGVLLGYRRDKDEQRLWLVCNAFPVLDADKNLIEVLLSFSDVTRLVESEAEARRLRELFELAARATQDAIFEWDINTGRFWANDAYKAIYGYEPADFVSLDNLEMTSAVRADHDMVREKTISAIKSGAERYSLDYEFVRPDGRSGHAAVRAFIVRGKDGGAQRIIGTATDIGQLTRATAALEQSEQRFRLIADTASDVLFDHDLDKKLTWSSRDWPQKLGVDFDPLNIQGFAWLEIVEPAERERLVESFMQVIKSDATKWEFEFHALAADRQQIVISARASVMRHANGRAARILGNMRNVTQEKRNQEGYTRARALEAVGQLTGGIAHDFNNLLMIILANAEVLELSDLGQEDADAVASITQAAESAVALTRRLLTFARQNQLSNRRVEVRDLVTETIILLRSGLPESVALQHFIPDDLWNINADPNGLQQAIVNLAMNAHDAMPRGGAITLTCANVETDDDMIGAGAELAPGRYVVISLSDSGEGMPPSVLSRAMEPFFTTKEVGKGTGLGLSTAYGFVRQSGGGATIYSEQGHGTTVNLYLPASPADDAKRAEPFSGSADGFDPGRRRILVVEDQLEVRSHVKKVLLRLGYEVTAVSDAASALRHVENGAVFDLIFTDIIMPGGMNGQELGEELAKLIPQTKILYTSGYPAAAFEHLGLQEQGSLHFLSKPYKVSELRKKVAEVLTGSASANVQLAQL